MSFKCVFQVSNIIHVTRNAYIDSKMDNIQHNISKFVQQNDERIEFEVDVGCCKYFVFPVKDSNFFHVFWDIGE